MHPLIEVVGSPLAAAYRIVTDARNALFDYGVLASHASSLPVLSVGNISVGGSGKTPFAGFVVEGLLELGRSPVILSRGYGGTAHGPREVLPTDDPMIVGDEPLLHSQKFYPKARTVIARKRVEGARFIEQRELGDVIVLDDGFQHRYLARNCDFVLVDVSREASRQAFRRGMLLPVGTMRERVPSALVRASALVAVSRGRDPEADSARAEFVEYLSRFELPLLQFHLRPGALRDVWSGATVAPSEFSEEACVATTAIAAPDGFFATLEELGLTVRDKVAYRDHHHYSDRDWARLSQSGAPVLATVKDAVKLRPYVDAAGQLFIVELLGSWLDPHSARSYSALVRSALAEPRT
ncbi:MAG: tetraacyldisaccharide 4'-kinase [Bdellovibrionales bacterium]|nr:tetraacyldisaccharide 4'-kinase [Bdellovibrionales bacterium]